MIRKYINYYDTTVYALYYKTRNTIYYNVNSVGGTKVILLMY